MLIEVAGNRKADLIADRLETEPQVQIIISRPKKKADALVLRIEESSTDEKGWAAIATVRRCRLEEAAVGVLRKHRKGAGYNIRLLRRPETCEQGGPPGVESKAWGAR